MHLPLPTEEFDSIFHEISNRLTSQGSKLSEKELLAILHRVMNGVEYLTRRYAMWWTTLLDDDQIDVGNPAQEPYTLILTRFGLEVTRVMGLSSKVAEEQGFTAHHFDDKDERAALNAFWNQIIAAAKANHIHKLA